MINDLDKLKEIVGERTIYSLNIKIWEEIEYRFGKNINIDTALKNYDYLDDATKKLLVFIIALQFLANEKISSSELYGNNDLLTKAYNQAIISNTTYGYGDNFEKFLNNWGENQGFVYKDIDYSKCLHMRVSQHTITTNLPIMQEQIKKELNY